MQFTCAHIFRGYAQTPYFDVSFLDFPPVNPKRYHEIKSKVSMLFDTSRDKVLKQKKEENKYSIFQSNYQETTLDYIFILVEENLEIYKI